MLKAPHSQKFARSLASIHNTHATGCNERWPMVDQSEIEMFLEYLVQRANDAGVCPHCLLIEIQNIEIEESPTDHWGDPTTETMH